MYSLPCTAHRDSWVIISIQMTWETPLVDDKFDLPSIITFHK